MDKFEEMLKECLEEKEPSPQKQKGPAMQRTSPRSSKPKREFEITVTYEEGKEEEAKVIQGKSETGAYALLFAVGRLLGELTDIDGDKIGCELVKAAIKIVAKQAMDNIFDDLKELL